MSYGPGDIDVRKVQLTGGSTYTLSLPKPWVDEMSLSPRDGVRIDWRPSGALRLTPIDMLDFQVRRVSINADKLPEDSLHDHLMGAYMAGVDKIRIRFRPEKYRVFRKEIRRFSEGVRPGDVLRSDRSHQHLEEHRKSKVR